jgi:hypothetical protein
MSLWRAEYESRNFSFYAYGLAHKDALDALYMGLEAHREQYNLEKDWFYKEDIYCTECRLGVAYRDNSIIYESKE